MEEIFGFKKRHVTHDIISSKREDIIKYLPREKEILEIYDKIDELIDDRIILLDRYEDTKSSEVLEKIKKIKEEMQTLFNREFEILSNRYILYEKSVLISFWVVIVAIVLFLLLFVIKGAG